MSNLISRYLAWSDSLTDPERVEVFLLTFCITELVLTLITIFIINRD